MDYFRVLGYEPRVVRNDEYSTKEILEMPFSSLVISPGPGRPEHSGVLMPLLKAIYGRVPIFGICLGMQALGLLEGAILKHSPAPVHGKAFPIYHNGKGIFDKVPSPFSACRYHSLILDQIHISELTISAHTTDGLPMAISSEGKMAWGVQFHPEAILTAHGMQLLSNWLKISEKMLSRENSQKM